MLATRLAQDRPSVSFSFNYDADLGFTTTGTLPPDDDVVALLHRLRPLVLTSEQTEFFRVCKIIDRRVRHESIQAELERCRDLFSGKRFQSLVKISVTSPAGDAIVLNSEATLQKWLKAYEYHRDDEKRQHLEDLSPAS